MKKVIVISTSLRRGSNSDMLADKFVEGVKSAGNDVEKISLVGKDIQFCKGCFGCQKLGKCVIKDDVNDIMAKVLEASMSLFEPRRRLVEITITFFIFIELSFYRFELQSLYGQPVPRCLAGCRLST